MTRLSPAPTPSAPAADTPLPGGRRWPFIIVGLLLLNVTVCAVTVTLSLRHPASVEPDYYDKAMNWDAHRGIAPADAAATDSRPAEED